MKKTIIQLFILVITSCSCLLAPAGARAQVLLQVDPSQPWIGYMNVFALPVNGGAYEFGFADGTAALQAVFSSTNLVLSPCTNVWETVDTTYVQADGRTPAVDMDANFYVENNALLNTNVIFSGTCSSNTLTLNPEPLTGVSYTSVAFVKVFDSGYTLLGSVTTNLIAGQFFSIAFNTTIANAAHVQYGFETFGPDASPTNTTLGDVVVAVAGQSATVTVDPSQNWLGYMNVSDLPVANGGDGVHQFGSPWGVPNLQAFLTQSNLTLLPCTNVWETTNTYWVQANGTTPNKMCDASAYVQNDNLINTNLIFIGTCQSNSLTLSPEPLTGVTYTSSAFIKTFDASFNLLGTSTIPLSAGKSFEISLNTSGAAHVQYGFETVGPDANPATAASLGAVVLSASVPPSPTPVLTNNAPTPTLPQSAVLSLYNSSGVYTNHPIERWLATWSGAAESPFTIPATGRTVLKYSNLQYAGVEFYNNDPTLGAGGDNVGGATNFSINTTGYDTMHVDLWTPNGNQFGVQLVSINPTEAAQVNFVPPGGGITNFGWVSLNIPLSSFATANPLTVFTNLQQLLWLDNMTNGVSGSTFYLDNVYFYNSSAQVSRPSIGASVVNGSMQISVATQMGHSYVIQYKNLLTDPVWQTLTTLTGNGSIQLATDVRNQSSRFYRILVQ